MAWIESHQSLGRHPKLLRLAVRLRIHKAQAVGHLKYLWWWALDFVAKNGDVSAFTSAEISAAAEWPGNAEEFYSALKKERWIDPDNKLHDWIDYSSPSYSSRERQKRYRKRLGKPLRNSDVTRYVTVTPTLPNQTIPNQKNKPPPPFPGGDFEALWAKQPRPFGKKEALRHFQADCKRFPDAPKRIGEAQQKYLAYLKRERIEEKFILNGKTFFNNWQDWENYKTPEEKARARDAEKRKRWKEQGLSACHGRVIEQLGDTEKWICPECRGEFPKPDGLPVQKLVAKTMEKMGRNEP